LSLSREKKAFSGEARACAYGDDIAITKTCGNTMELLSMSTRIDDHRSALPRLIEAFRQVPHTICYSVKAKLQIEYLALAGQGRVRVRRSLGRELERFVAGAPGREEGCFSGVGKRATK